jgi:glycosyltransferase involved in cell wall biosynthesis
MRLLINTATTFKRGGLQVAISIIHECVRFPENEYHVVLGENIAEVVNEEMFPGNFTFYTISYRPAQRVFSLKDQAVFFKTLEQKVQPDFVFTTSGPAYWRPNVPHLMGFNLPHYLYKDSPFFGLLPPMQKLKWWLKGGVIRHYTRKDADAYVVQTDDVNQRLRKWIRSEEVYTISNTYGSQYDLEPEEMEVLPKKTAREFRFLILSGYYRHKHLEILNPIIEGLQAAGIHAIQFVMTLPEEDFHRTIKKANRQQVLNIGPQPPQKGPDLYKACDAVFLPTLLECFSATYAEAMKMGLPIVTTDLGFAHTVCGDAALYYSPLEAKDAVTKIRRLYEQPEIYKKLVEAGKLEMKKFNSARERAEKYLALGAQLIQNSNK